MTTKEMVFAALFAALISVFALIPPIPIGFIPVPITVQTLGVMIAGGFLGKKVGAICLILFIVLVALGLPVLPGGRSGISVLVGPTGGYIFSWPIAAFCIGYATEKIWSNLKVWKMILINIVFGVLLINLIGAPFMALVTNTSVWAGLVGGITFLPGDCIKAVIAAIIVWQLKAISPIEAKANR